VVIMLFLALNCKKYLILVIEPYPDEQEKVNINNPTSNNIRKYPAKATPESMYSNFCLLSTVIYYFNSDR